MTSIMTTFWSGLAVGSIYILVALQFDLIYTATRIFNFGQTGFLVLSAFGSYVFLVQWHVPWLLTVATLTAGIAALSVLQEILTIRPLLRRGGADSHAWVVTTLGVGSALQGVALLVWGPDPRTVPFPGGADALTLLGGRVLPAELVVVSAAIAATAGMRLFLTRSRMGLATVATAADRDLATLRGINVGRVSMASFAVGGALVGASTALIVPITFASVDMGQQLILFAFAALAIGGFGTQTGTLLGGFVVGLVQAFSSLLIGPDAGPICIMVLLLVVLCIRPAGLFAARKTRTI
jgi:branched-chain amino acid transport system permease protein